jgi:hypothetical protein
MNAGPTQNLAVITTVMLNVATTLHAVSLVKARTPGVQCVSVTMIAVTQVAPDRGSGAATAWMITSQEITKRKECLELTTSTKLTSSYPPIPVCVLILLSKDVNVLEGTVFLAPMGNGITTPQSRWTRRSWKILEIPF